MCDSKHKRHTATLCNIDCRYAKLRYAERRNAQRYYVKHRCAECCYAEHRYAERRYAEYRVLFNVMRNVVMQSVVAPLHLFTTRSNKLRL